MNVKDSPSEHPDNGSATGPAAGPAPKAGGATEQAGHLTGSTEHAGEVPLSSTERSTVRRGRERARTDRTELYDLLDSCLICHLGLIVDGTPVVLPTAYGRDGDTLILHGSTGAASLMAAAGGTPVSIAVTRLDGIVYARSVFHLSVNYASAVIHATALPVTEPSAKLDGLRTVVEHVAPGSWDHARSPTRKELAATAVLAVPLHEASVKARTGPPVDEDDDVDAAEAWAGVLPLSRYWGTPEPCPLLPAGVAVPEHVARRAGVAPGYDLDHVRESNTMVLPSRT